MEVRNVEDRRKEEKLTTPITLPPLDEQTLTELRQRYDDAFDAETRIRYQMLLLSARGQTSTQIAAIVLMINLEVVRRADRRVVVAASAWGVSGASGTRLRKGRGAPLCTAGVASWNVVSLPHAVTRGEESLSRWCLTLRRACLCLGRGWGMLMPGARSGGAALPSPRHRPAALARQPRSAGSAAGLRWAHRGRQSGAPPQTERAARSPRS